MSSNESKMEKTGDFSFLIIFCLKWVDENQAKKTLMMNDSKFTDEKGHVATII